MIVNFVSHLYSTSFFNVDQGNKALQSRLRLAEAKYECTSGATKTLCLSGLRKTIAKSARFAEFKTSRANVQRGSADEAIATENHWITDVCWSQMQHYRWQRE